MIYIYKDEFNAIVINKNYHVGLHVQLISYIDRLIPNDENELENHISNFVELDCSIDIRNPDGNLNNLFKNQLKEAITKCQYSLTVIQQNREYIDGALKDYVQPTI